MTGSQHPGTGLPGTTLPTRPANSAPPRTTTLPALVVMDVDSTLIENEVIELVADYAGVTAEVARVTEQAMRGELDFEGSLRARVALLEGVTLEQVGEVRRRITVSHGARELIDGVQAAGGRVCAVSGGFHEVLDPLAADLGLDNWRANRFEAVDGVLTGRVSGPIVGREAKRDTLLQWAREYGIDPRATVAIGDGANDLGMMEVAGLSVAFCAKPIVRERASVSITERDLSRVLPLLGLRG
ncbi:phosphoserine phosphatase SerB [Pseudoclavibacter endophyticus]|uniref:phosphoserine phosphatase n=1 Tax=Pseudoclavibacter endophyticus TaxID=1778590 RepID=A0A6H9WGX4_9MICO|nr:phosphoserine phosphatase SerB [Pseudoclavibacter endophyticus]KAB1650162.1 phosphoserine phosphatase SerB [Pseudoclavibacter endophyticus]GGA56632.1 phosphoserine phosphatase SerB [Pseudoclavibacter endophyticus]